MARTSFRNYALVSVALLFAASGARAQVLVYSSFYQQQQQPDVTYHLAYHPYGMDEDSPPADVIRGGSQPMVRGTRAVVRNGVAYAPADAPEAVKQAIWAVNALRRKPYKFGGGHGSFDDSGYDCSGTISYALHYAGVLATPIPSSEFLSFGERGRGRWITIYSRSGHTFAVIAGLRLDTTGYYGTEGPRWHADGRDTAGYEERHPAGL